MDRSDGTTEAGRARSYHHGDLRNALLDAARTILEEESLAELSLRAVARKAGVSHAAPYRHFPNHEALLAELATEGFAELREEIGSVVNSPDVESDRIAKIGAAYMRFVARRPALASLMFGPQLPNRDSFPKLGEMADAVGSEIGTALHDSALGLAVWAAVHGLAMSSILDSASRAWTSCRRGLRSSCAVFSRREEIEAP